MKPPSSKRETRLPLFLALLSTAFFLGLHLLDPSLLREHLEVKSLDLRFHLRGERPSPPQIVIVAVDEASLKAVGRWPWSRTILADLLNKIAAGSPRVVGVDILVSEPEGEDADRRLAEALADGPPTVLAAAFDVPPDYRMREAGSEAPDYLWESVLPVVRGASMTPPIAADRVIPPIERLVRGSSQRGGGLGHIYSLPDRDGVLRWETLYLQYDGDLYPSFALQVARLARGLSAPEVVPYLGEGIAMGQGRLIPTDPWGRTLIDYYGREGSFRHLSAVDVREGRIPPEMFRDKIVLIGTTALGTYDQKVTPLSANMPGVEKNATVIANLLQGDRLRKSPGSAEALFIFVSGAALGLLIPRLRARGGAILAVAVLSGYLLLLHLLFAYGNLWMNFLYPTANLLVIFSALTVVRYIAEERRAREIRRIFSSYVSPRIVDELIRHPEKMRLGGERKEITVLFSDLRGFTSFAEKTEPEGVIRQLNEYLAAMTEVIFRWEGTLDKFVGDAIVAFWGAPLPQSDHGERAVRCALEMGERLAELRAKWAAEGKPVLDHGIGINTGEAVVGNIGAAGLKMDYTAIGDPVNVGARVEGQTRAHDASILITEFTRRKVENLLRLSPPPLELREVGEVRVKGREMTVRIYGVKSSRTHSPERDRPRSAERSD